MSHMDVHQHWLKIIYKRKSDQISKNYNEKYLSRVYANLPATVLEKL